MTQAREQCEKLLAQDGDWPEALYQHALVMNELGNRALKYDKIENAQVYLQAREKSARRRWELDPKDAQKQRDLSISFIKLGDVYVTLGRTADGLKYCEDALKIRRQLADADPKDAQKQRDLSVSFNRLGGVYDAGWRLRAPACPSSLGSLTPDARLAMDDIGDRRVGILVSFVDCLIRRVAGAVRLDEPDHPRHGVRRFDYVAVTAGAHGSEHRRAQGWRIGNLRQHQRQAGRVWPLAGCSRARPA